MSVTSIKAAMRPTIRDMRKHSTRSVAGIVLIALAVGVLSAIVAFSTSRDSASTRLADNTITYIGGSCLQSVDGTAADCVGEDGQPLWSSTSLSTTASTTGKDLSAPQLLSKALPEGLSAHNSETYSVTFSLGDKSYGGQLEQSPAQSANGSPVPQPGEIHLSQSQAKALGANVGDTITVSPMSGYAQQPGERKDAITLTVSRISPAYVASVAEGQWRDLDAMSASEINSWRLESEAPLTWEQVYALNKQGFVVRTSQFINTLPPADQVLSDPGQGASSTDAGIFAIDRLAVANAVNSVAIALIIAVVLLSLITPVFAIMAASNSSLYALMRSQGATQGQIRTTVIAYGLIFGTLGTAIGAVLGTGAGYAWWKFSFPGWQFAPDWGYLAFLWIGAVVGTSLAAALPAIYQARIDIIAAISGVLPGRMRTLRKRNAAAPILLVGYVLALVLAQVALPSHLLRDFFDYASPALVLVGLALLLACIPSFVFVFSRVGRGPAVRSASRLMMRQGIRTFSGIAALMSVTFIFLMMTTLTLSSYAHSQSLVKKVFNESVGAVNFYDDSASSEEIDATVHAAQGELGTSKAYFAKDVVFGQTRSDTYSEISHELNQVDATDKTLGSLDNVVVPGLAYNSAFEVGPEFLDLIRLDDADKQAALTALSKGGAVMPQADNTSDQPYVENATVTVNYYGGSSQESTMQEFTLPVAYVLPRGLDTVFLSPSAVTTLGGQARHSTVFLTTAHASSYELYRAEEAVARMGVNASFDAGEYLRPDFRYRAYAAVFVVLLAVLGLVIALSYPHLRRQNEQYSAIGATNRQLRTMNATYYGLLCATAVVPASLAAVAGVWLTRTPDAFASTGELLSLSEFPDFQVDWPGLLIFAVVFPIVATAIGYLTSPSVGIAYRED